MRQSRTSRRSTFFQKQPGGKWVYAEFARYLERERDQLRAEVERLEAEGYERLPAFMRMTDWKARAERAESQLARRDEALKVAGEALKNCLNNSPLNPFERADAIQSALRRIEELTKGEGP